MKVTSVSVQLSAKKTVNYQSVQNSVGLTADLDEDDRPDEVVRELQRQCHALLLKRGDGDEP